MGTGEGRLAEGQAENLSEERSTGGILGDPRYAQANREAVAGLILFAANFLWWAVTAYGLGGRPVGDYTYVWGFPAWFFYSCVAGMLIFSVATWLMVRWFFRDVPLDPAPEERAAGVNPDE